MQSGGVEHNARIQNDIESFFFQIVGSCDSEGRGHLSQEIDGQISCVFKCIRNFVGDADNQRSAEIVVVQREVAALNIKTDFDLIFNYADGSCRKHCGRKLYGACFGVRCVDTNSLSRYRAENLIGTCLKNAALKINSVSLRSVKFDLGNVKNAAFHDIDRGFAVDHSCDNLS